MLFIWVLLLHVGIEDDLDIKIAFLDLLAVFSLDSLIFFLFGEQLGDIIESLVGFEQHVDVLYLIVGQVVLKYGVLLQHNFILVREYFIIGIVRFQHLSSIVWVQRFDLDDGEPPR